MIHVRCRTTNSCISQDEFLSNLKSDTLEPILEAENLNQLIKEAISRVFSGVSAVYDFEIMSEYYWVAVQYFS